MNKNLTVKYLKRKNIYFALKNTLKEETGHQTAYGKSFYF